MSFGGVAAAVAVGVLSLARRHLAGVFERLGATSPEAARSRESLGLPESRLWRRMVRRGVLREAAEGAFYLDRRALESDRRRRRAVALLLAATLLVALGWAVVR